ncbi:MAG: DUF3450 family protein [Phycisphaerales bacterium]|nr:MAG: DUF3450 family protein [Phycisphaerales bacterium]
MARRWLQLSALFVGVVVSCMITHQAFAASTSNMTTESQTDLLGTLQDLVSRLRTQRQAYYQQKAQDDARIQEAQENVQVLQAQVTELRQQEADLDAEIRKHRAEVETLAVQEIQRTQVRRIIASKAATFAAQQENEIEKGIPYKQSERIARLRAGLADANEVDPPSVAELLGHLWSYAQEELRLADSSETYSDRTTVEGDLTPYARYFRVGQWMLGYVTEDGNRTALWLPRFSGGTWEPILESSQMTQVRDAVEILDRRRAPGFVSLPITTGPWLIEKVGP